MMGLKTDVGEKIEAKINALPIVDVAVLEIISLLDNPDSNFDQIVKKLSPGVVAIFLSMANAAYYGRNVRTIEYAVRVLGFIRMKQILIISLLMDHFSKRSDMDNFNFPKFQKQAWFCGGIAQVLGKILGFDQLEDLYTVSILHNIGKLIIAIYFKDEYKKIIDCKQSMKISTSEAERKIMGLNHAEIGYLILKKLNISEDICDAVRFHDLDDPFPPENADFHLGLITREAGRIVDSFLLPEEMDPMKFPEQLKGTVEEGQKICREMIRRKMRSKGYVKLFGYLLKEASRLVYTDLKIYLNERTNPRTAMTPI